MKQLDQTLIELGSSHETINSHSKYDFKWEELKNYLAKLNKDITSKKQAKMAKDKAAFTSGFAYCWHISQYIRGPPRNKNNQHCQCTESLGY